MRRRFVSEEDRDRIIQLRKSGGSWLAIENMTGIPRRTAKGVYDEWQKNWAAEEVVNARRQVAADAFKMHMRDLIMLGREITNNYTIPDLNDRRNSQQVLNNIFEKDIREKNRETSPFTFVKRDLSTTIRQNHILLDSLKQHTQEKVEWDLLNKWEAARNNWWSTRKSLETEVCEQVSDIANNNPGNVANATLRQPGITDRVIQGILETIYHILVDNESQVEKYIKIKGLESGWAILFGGDISDTELFIEDKNISSIIGGYCRSIARGLFTDEESSLIQNMATSLAIMREAHKELMDKLDELRLTPIILQTRCDICPA